MACNLKIWLMVSFTLLPLVFGVPQVPCLFIMGDSLLDNGNNNNLQTTAKSNYPPYGIDFPEGPTGRFSNGKNMADFIAEFLGFDKPIPPFATATDQDILMGVNYASGAAGIRDETGYQLGDRISLKRQLVNHQTIVSRIGIQLGSKEAASNYLSKCIYLVNIGSNDYINNYLMPQKYPTSMLYSPDQYAAVLNQQYSELLKILYTADARKIALFGLGLIGCIPAEIAIYGTNGCVDMVNEDVQLFNNGLVLLVNDINRYLTNAQFIYVNVTEISSGDPSVYGKLQPMFSLIEPCLTAFFIIFASCYNLIKLNWMAKAAKRNEKNESRQNTIKIVKTPELDNLEDGGKDRVDIIYKSLKGITVTNAPCCIVSTTVAKGQCAPNQVPCGNRSMYSFFDGFHPTQIASLLLAAGAYSYLPPLIL